MRHQCEPWSKGAASAAEAASPDAGTGVGLGWPDRGVVGAALFSVVETTKR